MNEIPINVEGTKVRFSTSPIPYFPIQLRLLKKLREETKFHDESTAINILTITSCTAFIETVLFDCLNDVISKIKINQSDESIMRVIKNLESSIETATIRNFENLSEDVLGKSLSSFTNAKTWEAIRILFMLRNQIIHGKKLTAEYTLNGEQYEGEYHKNYRDIVNYFLKIKLREVNDVSLSGLLSDKIANFFIEKTTQFFIDVTKNISARHKTSTFETFENLRKQLTAVTSA